MLIQMRTITVKTGFSGEVVEKFNRPGGPMSEIPGFIDKTVMLKKSRSRSEETEVVVVFIRWESEEAWKTWEKSPAHIAGHRNSHNQEKPDYLLSTEVTMYEVQ
ncbi:antibiotic biosynthesis monooxygenase [Paenibacillus sp. HN-1]|uniref:antibiotic biosynthesis monooxygenase family protein n=2 Tax=Paenibacillus TaxID=44249 RepID=UPI001CA80016|nr:MULTISPECIES: antibiotic biosynthesis monooxygenase [Paenibacillus]MBY9078084.1 antibiotic biosynthesis monooxygenase [Paenibacillus sp. CGMCC 1.18879]MBY9083825.1 antibiotic biosynthesis monooxygenase [Paenibacillus sinensis]